MRRAAQFVMVAGGLTVMGFGVHLAPDALSRVAWFDVQHVQLEGLRYMEESEAVAFIALPEGYSLWDDLDRVGARLALHPLIDEVRPRRRLPSTLRLEVTEREPVALLAHATLTPVDREGRSLPIDPSRHRLDLPLLHAEPGTTETSAGEGVERSRRILAREVARLEELEPAVAASLSEIALDPWGDVEMQLGSPQVRLHYTPPLTPERLRAGIASLTDALERHRDRTPVAVDLRFADQVFIRYPSQSAR